MRNPRFDVGEGRWVCRNKKKAEEQQHHTYMYLYKEFIWRKRTYINEYYKIR